MGLTRVPAIKASDGEIFVVPEEAADHELGIQMEAFVEGLISIMYDEETPKRTVTISRAILIEAVTQAAKSGLVFPTKDAIALQEDAPEEDAPEEDDTEEDAPRAAGAAAAKRLVDGLAKRKSVGIDGE